MNYDTTRKFIEEQFETEVIPNLSEYIRIDNLSPSFDPEWNTNGKQDKAAELIFNWALNQGVKGITGSILKDEDKTPLIYLEIQPNNTNVNEEFKTYLLYGHFDKQPHFPGWLEGLGPTLPVIKDDRLYGRGGADDGYAIFSSILAIKSIQEQNLKHGKTIIIIEGSEESGSPHLVPYLDQMKQKIGSPDLVVVLDSGVLDYETLWLTTSLRGLVSLSVTVDVLEEGVHSGAGTGIAPDSFTIMRELIDRVECSKNSKVIEQLHVEIPKHRIEEIKKVSESGEKVLLNYVKLLHGVKYLNDDYTEVVLNNSWRPTLCITGASGFPSHEIAGNVLRASTSMSFSFRLPPTLDSEKAGDTLVEILTRDPPYNAKVTVQREKAGNGWHNKEHSQKLKDSLSKSSLKLFGKDVKSFGGGGSIPFLNLLQESFPKCEFLVIGILGPDSNAHTANECLNISYTKNITTTLAHTLYDYEQ